MDNAYMGLVPTCLFCQKSMQWIKTAETERANKIPAWYVRCDTKNCKQYHVDFYPPTFELKPVE